MYTAGQEWIAVGTVVEGAGSTGKKAEYLGKEYDFVFDVDIEDGKPALKLPYNLSENPYERATKFLGDNELPLSYLDSVANFIVENTKGATMGQDSQPASSDPFGTESRYRPGDESGKKKYLPHAEYISLTQAKFEPIQKKILSLNATNVSNGNKEHALNPDQEEVLKTMIQTLSAAGGKPTTIPDKAVILVLQLATQWPYSDRLPGLDLLRCIAPMSSLPRLDPQIVQHALSAALEPDTADAKVNENAVMMAVRAIANLFATPAGRALAASGGNDVVKYFERIVGVSEGVPAHANAGKDAIGMTNKNLQIALTSAAFNYATLAYLQHKGKADAGLRDVGVDVLALLCNILEKVVREQDDNEVLYRALMGLGMVLAIGGDIKETVKDLDAEQWIRVAIQKASEQRVKDVGEECLGLLRGSLPS